MGELKDTPRGDAIGGLMIRAAVLRNLALLVTMGVAFTTMPMIIHLLGDSWYGIWVLVGTFMGYFGIIDFGLTSATTRYLALHWKEKNAAEIGKTMTTSFVGFCFISAIVLVLSLIAIWMAPEFLDDKSGTLILRSVLLVLAIDMAMSFPFAIYSAVLVVQMRNDIVAVVRILQALIKLGIVFWIVNIDGTIIHIALMTLGLNILMRVALVLAANKYLPAGVLKLKNFSKSAIKEYFHFGKFTFLGKLGDMVRFRVDVMVIAGSLGSSMVVPYEISLQLLRILSESASNIIAGTQPIFTRYFAEGRMDLIREKLFFLTRVNVVITTIFACSLMMIAQPLITIWVGPEYQSAFMPLVILAAIAPLGVGQNAAIQTFYAMSKHRYYAYINICEAVANLTISLLLVERFGIMGVALGTAIPFVISKCIFVPYYICKFTEVSLTKYLLNLFTPIIFILLLEAVCAGIIYYFQVDNFWVVFLIISSWQLLIGVSLLILAPLNDYEYFANTVPAIRKVINRKC